MTAKDKIIKFAKLADIEINGSRPWDIQVHDERFYSEVLQRKMLGLGESYMAGWWDCSELDECVLRFIQASTERKLKYRFMLYLHGMVQAIINFQTKRRSQEVAKRHYDLGNDLFQAMLDECMIYSCGYWEQANDLNQAQQQKLALVCEKLELKPGMRLLDIGCGWGGLAKYAALHYGVEVVGITISKEQARLAKEVCAGLPVEIRVQDYRDLKGQFDRIASLGMFEHVGKKNYRRFMRQVKKSLKPNGLFLLHTIGNNQLVPTPQNEWIRKYIFPNGELPSIEQLGQAWEGIFLMEDWHNFGAYYYQTLKSWHHNFNQYWEKLKLNYDDTFRRMWNFYLLICAGAAKARDFQVWQIVLSNGVAGGYQSVRRIPHHECATTQ